MAVRSSSDHPHRATGGAEVSVRIGDTVAFDARITVAGLLAVGALLSGTLLSSAAIVLAARRRGRSPAPERIDRAVDARPDGFVG